MPKIDITITRERDKGVVVGEELDEVPYEVGGGAAGVGPGFEVRTCRGTGREVDERVVSSDCTGSVRAV